jgi:type I restriction enzyme S subunit
VIDGLRPYPQGRPTGLPWLGAIPEHWEIRRLKFLLKERDARSVDGLEQLLRVSQYTGVTERRGLNEDGEPDTRARSLVGYKLVDPGDLAVNIMLAWNGSLGVSAFHGIVSPAYCVYRFLRGIPWYFHYLLRSPDFRSEVKAVSTGVVDSRLRLYTDDLYRLSVPVPPESEQAAIVRFLSYVDRRIRRYIGAKQTLTKLLEEQKQGIIHRVVTRGLNPNVNLKPSGVEWLGDVPQHWEVSAIRHRYSQGLGKMLDSKRITGEHLVPYVRNTDVQWDHVNTFDLPMMDISPDEIERYTVRTGDLLVCEGGEVGRAAIWTNESGAIGFQKALHRLRPRSARQDEPRFLFYALRAASDSDAFNDGHVSTIAHLTGDKLRAHRFPFPPIDEQRAIVVALDRASTAIDNLVSKVQRGIRIAREYRTRLIADVVTGKLDVREAEAWLSDEAEEPELLDEADAESNAEEADSVDLDDVPDEAEV